MDYELDKFQMIVTKAISRVQPTIDVQIKFFNQFDDEVSFDGSEENITEFAKQFSKNADPGKMNAFIGKSFTAYLNKSGK